MPGVVYILPPPTKITSAEAIELLIARLDNLREAPLQHAGEVQAALFSPTSPLAATRSQQATRTQPSVTITWLHLSDLHFRTSQAYDTNIVLRALLRDVAERIEQDGLHPDFIVVTGDIAFAGQPAEYALARPFFDDLLKTTGLSCERLFVVPGNHDVDRSLVSQGAQGIGDSLKDRNSTNAVLSTPGDRQLMFARLKGYAAFANDYLSGHLTFDDDHYFYIRTLDLAGQQIALLGLNSAWLCASDQDKAGGLLIGERQTWAALEQAEGATLKIALLHHPFDWLREFDQNDSAAMLLDNCDFVLHGHLHQTAATQLISPDGAATVLACGACYETREFPNMVNWVRLDLSAGTGTVYLRRYSDARGGFWAKDTLTYKNVPDGVYIFDLPAHLRALPTHLPHPRILIVDDARNNRQRLVSLFRAEGWYTEEAETNAQALNLLFSARIPFSLVTTDALRRPERAGEGGYVGLDLVRTINQRLPRLPVILVSRDSPDWLRQLAPDLRINGLLGKSLSDAETIAMVRKVLAGETLPNPWSTNYERSRVNQAPDTALTSPADGSKPAVRLHVNPDNPPIAAIWDLLTAAFTPEDLRRFCRDRPAFRSVVAKLGPGHGLDDIVDQVIDYCQAHLLWDELLAEVAQVRSQHYARFEPRLRGQARNPIFVEGM